ncbi:hypothetical protein XM47_12770 [Catenovulum maritimum]|uniref:Uncharacterized protein n=1 Tax=Catenovulum maritimum TaxID=1513271 RepID=A0A0J8GPL8_9ALTE|nr:hypothetical protein XM47_12770 [Catenovulum maritimum]
MTPTGDGVAGWFSRQFSVIALVVLLCISRAQAARLRGAGLFGCFGLAALGFGCCLLSDALRLIRPTVFMLLVLYYSNTEQPCLNFFTL